MSKGARPYVVVGYSPQASVADRLKQILESAGLTVCAACSDPDELESVVGRANPDAIVYEVGFPVVENWRQFQEVRGRAALSHVPIVVATEEALELHRRVHVSAPLEALTQAHDPTELRSAVRNAIAASRFAA